MDNIINKTLLFTILCLFYLMNIDMQILIIPILIIISIEGICIYFDNNKLNIIFFLIYFVLCLFKVQFIFFIPLLTYDLINKKNIIMIIVTIIISFIKLSRSNMYILLVLIFISLLGHLIKLKTTLLHNQKIYLAKERDKLIENSLNLKRKIDEMTIKQNDQITIATLNERNRISREIHDNVGHLLSCSLLQIGAIKAISKDSSISKNIDDVKLTLDKAMDSMRKSVHNLREDSIDLNLQIKSITSEFTFCKLKYDYDIKTDIKIDAKYNILFIIKESLNNIIKHSKYTTIVNIKLYEHPKLIQLIIYDNGKTCDSYKPGMGIENITNRVNSLKGNINIINENGFKIFISFDKENLI